MSKHKIVIGRTDIADFPDLGFNQVEVKIDTGAYTSSIHCKSIKVKDGKLYCIFLDEKHPEYSLKTHTFENFKTIRVKSSNGISQKRYEIKSKIKLFDKIYSISLSLSDRKDMKYPVLLGRKFLNPKFIVDPALIDLSHKNNIYEYQNIIQK
ncbi:ATP-dependent zinc protease family protein [Flavobacteriaceae bacterium 14752]|uniref:ATP-dependent zinc protease family protein n=1 Tax=Mesohalobacter salilacus TaxID=2491711 RepID=UPI000F63E8F7|nr:peptidase [Flavobacteriaceae bacterium 14752]